MENNSEGFFYLATPYARYPHGKIKAFEAAAEQAGILIRNGIPIFCPITHSHPIHPHINRTDAHRFWLNFDKIFMELAKGLIVCQLEGWQESRGIAKEIDFFSLTGKPIIPMHPGKIPMELVRNLP